MALLNRRQSGADITGSPAPAAQVSPATVLKALRIDGQISAQEDMYIDADINGPITSDSKVTIGPRAAVHGPVKARHAIIFGQVIGDVDAVDKVELREGAQLIGDIYTVYISLDEKARFSGKVDCRRLGTQGRPISPPSETRSVVREARSA